MMVVYAMVTELAGRARFVKFGMASEPLRRLMEVQCGCPLRIEVILYVECPSLEAAAKLEAALHLEHQEQNTSGEWFRWGEGSRALREAEEALVLVGQREVGDMPVRRHDAPRHTKRLPRALARYRTFGRRHAATDAVVGDADLSQVQVTTRRRKSLKENA